MRFYTVLASRPMYYDRNPLDVVNTYFAASVAPHTVTTRWTYTVPTARKAFWGLGHTEVFRDGAAGSAQAARGSLSIAPSGFGSSTVLDVRHVNAAVDTWREQVFGSSVTMLAGDALTAVTADGSTGGTNTYNVSSTLTEFDA